MNRRPIVIFSDITLGSGAPQGTRAPNDLIAGYMQELLERAEVLAPGRCAPEAISAGRGEAVVLVSRVQPVSAADLDAMPCLRLISAWGVGYNHVDVAEATERGIPVCINPVFSRAVAEAALTLILALSKRLPARVRAAREGRGFEDIQRGTEILGKTLGVIGFGRIGREIGDMGQRLQMRVLAHDPYMQAAGFPSWCAGASLEHLLRESDFVVVAAPLTPETHHLIGAAQLSLMRPTAFLVNIGRGPLVDEAALLTALEAGRIAGAGLDVWEREPVRPDHPLLTRDDVIGTPHSLAQTRESLKGVCMSIQANVLRVLAGERPHDAINPQVFKEKPQ